MVTTLVATTTLRPAKSATRHEFHAIEIPPRRLSLDHRLLGITHLPARLVAKPEPQKQHDDRADDRPDDAGRLNKSASRVVVEEQVAQEAADERPDHAQQDGAADGQILLAGHGQPGE